MKTLAPSDAEALAAWRQIADLAQKHALIVNAYGGMLLLMTPDEKRAEGVRERVLMAEQMTEAVA